MPRPTVTPEATSRPTLERVEASASKLSGRSNSDKVMTGTLAAAILSAAALLELEAVLIDGWMPAFVRAEVTRRTQAALLRLDLSGVTPPVVREGSVGAQARSLGAAAIPLSQRYLIDQNAALRDG